MNDRSSNKSETLPRRHGWFARKFLPRPSATYIYKARTTYRPITRKKSFSSRSSSFSDDGRRNILEGKTLEETCKLGGLGVLMLPKGYCLETPTLPTCLSATATYLLNHGAYARRLAGALTYIFSGVNASGLFRISGQASIVNALYDYYAHQFGHAGSPTKVQTTVQSGQLPLHIEYTLADVATFFKKVLKGLSGGLLGSVEVFEAISQTLLRLEAVPSLSDDEMKALRARMIALSLLSITSLPRFNLIQAVLGLFAYLADQAELTRATMIEDSGSLKREASLSGLMGYQAFGVCLGPLLIGDLMEDFSTLDNLEAGVSKKSLESGGKSKKKTASNKLENSSDLNVLVGRANMSANVMQQMLILWRDVVQQLRLATASEKALRNSAIQQPSRLPHFAAARNAIRVTDEELRFLKMMRDGEVPMQYPFDVIVKRKTTAKSKSSMPQLLREPPPEQRAHRDWFHQSHDRSEARMKMNEEQKVFNGPIISFNSAPIELSTNGDKEPVANNVMERGSSYRGSIASLDEMIAGQILPPREDLSRPSMPPSSDRRSPNRAFYTPTRRPSSKRRTSSTGFASKDDHLDSLVDDAVNIHRENGASEATILPRRGLPPPPVEPPPVPELTPTSRRSSRHSRLPTEPTRLSAQLPSASGSRAASIKNNINALVPNPVGKASGTSAPFDEKTPYRGGRSYRSSRSNSGVGLEVKDCAPKFELPIIPPFEDSGQSGEEDPFVQGPSPSTPKRRESLLPKPTSHGARAADPPPKSPASFKRKSVFNIVKRDSPGPSKIAVPIVTREPQFGSIRSRDVSQRSQRTIDALQPISAQCLNSLTLRDLQALDSLPIEFHKSTHQRSASDTRAESQNEQLNTVTKSTSDSRSATNSTLFAEITRLKRQLEHKDETLLATRRSLEAATMTKEHGPTPPSGSTTPKRGSWNKGTLSHEVKAMKNQRDGWKQRAEWAEKRLGGIEEQGQWSEKRAREV